MSPPADNTRIRNAILRELNRDGQVYFVHNRVHSIHEVANELRTLVPEKPLPGGPRPDALGELEEVMHAFVDKQADVLVSTTIIESGLDIPTANTIFINDADRFGLAELHQLRDRVGRYKPPALLLSAVAQGSPHQRGRRPPPARPSRNFQCKAGFKIAMRDMEIRGVGNLLGPEQSGHIAVVGYDMYCRLLEQATAELRHERLREPLNTHLELGIVGYIPKAYIPSDRNRMAVYRRVARLEDPSHADQIERDLIDAYGPIPASRANARGTRPAPRALFTLEIDSLKLHEKDLIFKTHRFTELFKLFEKAPEPCGWSIPPPTASPRRSTARRKTISTRVHLLRF